MPNIKINRSDLVKIPEDAMKAAEDIARLSRVTAVFLFGSYAKGLQRTYSDVDLCVITENIDAKTKNEILMSSSKKVEIHIFEDMPLNLQFRVFEEGLPVFVKSQEKMLVKKLDIIRRYQDFRPRLERYWEAALA
ncbi:MAG TPA: nucleotidyltransferase domain-containing protein [archaeon]|nr:nucleotidyltransferase domain-containing protein [archaeon]